MRSAEYQRGYDAAMREIALLRRGHCDQPAPLAHEERRERFGRRAMERMRGRPETFGERMRRLDRYQGGCEDA